MKISPLICFANQYSGFCMIGTSFMKELIIFNFQRCFYYESLTSLMNLQLFVISF